MKISPIKNEKDYQNALDRLEMIFDARKGTQQGDELEILSILIDKYENENFPIEMPDPIEAIKFRMEQMGMSQKDLADVIGFKSRVSLGNSKNLGGEEQLKNPSCHALGQKGFLKMS